MKLFFVLIAAVAAADEFKMLQKFSQRVDAMTNGRLKVEVLPDGAVVGAFEILDAVGSPSGGSGLGMPGSAWRARRTAISRPSRRASRAWKYFPRESFET